MNIKSKMKINNVYQVATHRLCLGCGACYSAYLKKKSS